MIVLHNIWFDILIRFLLGWAGHTVVGLFGDSLGGDWAIGFDCVLRLLFVVLLLIWTVSIVQCLFGSVVRCCPVVWFLRLFCF